MTKRALLLPLLLVAMLVGCTQDEEGPDGPRVDLSTSRTDLGAALGVSDLTPVGVTIEPRSGRLLVLDADRGIYEIDKEGGAATLVWGLEKLEGYGVTVGSAFTDLVAIDEGVFAMTAVSDGFLLDLEADTFAQHFCYEPGDFDEPFDEPALQITDSVTYDPTADLIIAQPRTILGDISNAPMDALVATYDRDTGADLQWFNLPDTRYVSGGMVYEPAGTLLMGVGGDLYRYDITEGQLDNLGSLARFGVREVQGMALDSERGALYVIDGQADALVEIDMTLL